MWHHIGNLSEKHNTKENCIILQEISKLLKKKVMVQKIAEKGDFSSSVFLRAKKELEDDSKSEKVK